MKIFILFFLSFCAYGEQSYNDFNENQQVLDGDNFYENNDDDVSQQNTQSSDEANLNQLEGDFDSHKDPLIQEVVGWDVGEYLFIMTHHVYLRKGPGLFYPTLRKLDHNQKVKILEKGKKGWILVSHGGWLPRKTLDVRRHEKPQKYRESLTTIVRLKSVKVYGGPGFHYPIVSHRMKGDRVRIIRNHGPWAQIGASQYVVRKLIDGRKLR